MTRRINLDQWTNREELPAIVWTYTGVLELEPVAVNDSHDSDVYDELTHAWYAARAFMTWDEVVEEYRHEYTTAQLEELYSNGDGSADRAGLPREYYVEGAAEDGSDVLIYVDEATEYNTRRESLEDAAQYLYPEDVAEIYREVIAARER